MASLAYSLLTSFNFEDKEYTSLTLDFSVLAGPDMRIIKEQFADPLRPMSAPWLDEEFCMLTAIRAAGLPFEALDKLSFLDNLALTTIVRNFFTQSGLLERIVEAQKILSAT